MTSNYGGQCSLCFRYLRVVGLITIIFRIVFNLRQNSFQRLCIYIYEPKHL